jgi:cobalamin biosynthesis protein CobD
VLATAAALDLALGEPPNGLHPVVWFGRLVSAAERRAPRGTARLELAAGTAVAMLSIGAACASGLGAMHALRRLEGHRGRNREGFRSPWDKLRIWRLDYRGSRLASYATGWVHLPAAAPISREGGAFVQPPVRMNPVALRMSGIRAGAAWLIAFLAEAWLLKTTLAVRELFAAARAVQVALERGDLEAARRALRSLVSRETDRLGAPLIAAAAVESVAENASDSIVAPALAYLTFGLPGAAAYRAINTLDAMIGYRGEHEWIGKAAAKLDDLANFVPARLTAALVVLGATARRSGRAALAALRADHGKTASPNSGWPMSAIAGALGVELEKVGQYRLGAPGSAPAARDIGEAISLVRLALGLGFGVLVGLEGMRRARAA